MLARTVRTSRPSPPRYLATSSTDPTVADRPTRWNSPEISTSRSKATASCAPRSLLASSWISSMTTCLTRDRCSRSLLPVNSTCTVSGVVMSTSGGSRDCCCRSVWEVSPCLTATLRSRASPNSVRRLSMSRFSARRGVM
ncbi:MAG: hypothetical protein A4E31_00874 [Methanomassiliicoccales archaeon PtaU1.Bin030]|nr:MAG: hypothetical protein A4E31_00874 [Methanomassiliicoccales archaeon PtaU1.Bin030]